MARVLDRHPHPLMEKRMFEIGLSDTPVIRDGRTTDRSYVVLACKVSDQYNAVVWGVNSEKLKFYPSAEFWGITQGVLQNMELNQPLYTREGYQGIVLGPQSVVKVLNIVAHQRSTQAVPADVFLDWVKSKQPRDNSLHPRAYGTPSPSTFGAWSGARRSS